MPIGSTVGKVWSVSRNTFQETVRQPVYALIVALGMGMLITAPAVSAFTFADDNMLLRDMALSTLLLAGLFLSSVSAASVLSEEIENKTVLTVVSKPVGRATFIIGKYVGVASAILMAMYVLTLCVLMVLRQGVLQRATDESDMVVLTLGGGALAATLILAGFLNFIYDWKFPATAVAVGAALLSLAFIVIGMFDREWRLQSFYANVSPDFIKALALVSMAVLVLSAIAVAISTRFNTPMTVLVCCLVFLLGIVSDYYFGNTDGGWGLIPYTLLPIMQAFWMADPLQMKDPIPTDYVLKMVVYTCTYVAAMISLGIAMFQTREVG
jgi:hypothetical protein